jgi:hypothetical protein
MEKQIHDIIMPLSEKLIKQLSQLLEKPENRTLSLFGIELVVVIAHDIVCTFRVQV